MFDAAGNKVWEGVLDIYGRLRTLQGDKSALPFRYLGQYEDTETGLYYNRFRYYSPEEGVYITQDPVGLLGGTALYRYVKDTNGWVDPMGLTPITNKFPTEELPAEGKIVPHELVDGKIKVPNGLKQVDFVVTQDGTLVVGKKHHTLGNRQDVLAAGQMKLNGQGKVRGIDNLSGHYQPSVDESLRYPEILRSAGVDVTGATLEVSEFTTNQDGMVTGRKIAKRQVCN
jgi:RHS repeat-associated protein